MHFLFPALATGFVLLAAPALVHLINLFRHRRQDWAAMEFLLAAYRKQRKWVVLRQLLLLLLRTLAILTLVAMLAGWISGSRLLDALGGSTQHHLIILDDSYSMDDRSGNRGTAYQTALTALDGFVNRLLEDAGSHQLTILRTSRASLAVKSGLAAGDAAADLSDQTIVPNDRNLARVMATTPSPLAVGLEPALQLAAGLVEHSSADQSHVYLLTDLRARQWQSSRQIAEQLSELGRLGAAVKLIDCATTPEVNLSVTSLAPIEDVWAAGVPTRVRVVVHNYGNQPVTDVSLSASIVHYTGDTVPRPEEAASGTSEQLPDVLFERIEANSEATKVFQVYVADAGTHAIRVSLPDDCLLMDNQRTCTLPLAASRRMLLVQGQPDDQIAYYLRSAIDPGGAIRTGWSVDVRSTTFLSTASMQDLAAYDNVWLLDVANIDGPVSAALQGFVRNGGGLGIWLGPNSQVEAYNQYLGGTEGILPGKLLPSSQVRRAEGKEGGDLTLDAPHPITAPLAAIGPALLSNVRVNEAYGWEPDSNGIQPTVLLRLPNNNPLALINRADEGNVLLMTSALDRRWTNWPADPSFVVFVLQAAADLSQGTREATHYPVGEPVEIKLSSTSVARDAEFYAATLPPRSGIEVAIPESKDGAAPVFVLTPAAMMVERVNDYANLLRPGVAELTVTELDGRAKVLPMALTIDGSEGNLQRIERGELQQSIRPATLEILDAQSLAQRGDVAGNSTRALLLLGLLILLLFAEQLAAYAASYHVRPSVALEGNR